MSDLRKAAQQALAALEYSIKPMCWCWAGCEECDPEKAPDTEKTVAALRAALAQEQAEPSGYCTLEQLVVMQRTVPSPDKIAIYTAPPQRPLLTDGEIAHEVYRKWGMLPGANSVITEFARAIERKVRGEE